MFRPKVSLAHCLILLFSLLVARGNGLELALPFSDHAVLQAGKPVPIWALQSDSSSDCALPHVCGPIVLKMGLQANHVTKNARSATAQGFEINLISNSQSNRRAGIGKINCQKNGHWRTSDRFGRIVFFGIPSAYASAMVWRTRLAMAYGSPCEFGRRSSR